MLCTNEIKKQRDWSGSAHVGGSRILLPRASNFRKLPAHLMFVNCAGDGKK
jgi:hypothetical protein